MRNHGRRLLIITIVLTFLGLLAVADSSGPQALAYFKDSFYFVKSQLTWIAIGIVLLFVGMIIDYHIWKRFASLFFIVNVILLFLVLIPGIGTKVLGARRWIYFGNFNLQPSEFIKLSLIFYLAKLTELKRPFLNLIIPVGLVAVLVMLEPDMGTTIAIIIIGFIQIFVSGASIIPFIVTGLGGFLLGCMVILISSYRRQRLSDFVNLLGNPLSSTNYHVRQILIALGTGGLLGVGLGQGKQKYLFLPESATDSVFANIGEELGFLGSIVIIGLLAFFVYEMLKIATSTKDRFAAIVASGIIAWMSIQIFLNIASMVALVPLTGVPLPFFSYGGSNLTVILFAVGVLINISKESEKK